MRLTENLRLFNTKERFHLVSLALGNSDFTISNTFREELNKKLKGLNLQENEPHYFAAMDYHIDWIYASLCMTFNDFHIDQAYKIVGKETVKRTQEDIDFLICIDREDGGKETSHMIFLEAKGVTGWSNKQMESKAERLRQIFGDKYGSSWKSHVIPYFAIISPFETKKLVCDSWPDWMKGQGGKQPPSIKLPLGDLRKVTCCNNNGKPDKKGEYWKIEKVKGNL